MQPSRHVVLGVLGSVAFLFAADWWLAVRRTHRSGAAGRLRPSLVHSLIGFATDFLDTLGIGSFATTTTAYRLGRVVPDERIPGTLNVGHALPTVVQALVYVTIIEVDMTTLVAMIAAAVAGAWVFAARVATWPRRTVRVAMGGALLGAACLMLAAQVGALPKGGEALALRGSRLAAAVAANFALGALMTAGIGLYAPCMILVSALGMDPIAAFPIMMGSCAFLMPVASARFIRSGAYDTRAALGLALGGAPAVLLAAWVVRSLPISALRWLVIGVAAYTAGTLLVAARKER